MKLHRRSAMLIGLAFVTLAPTLIAADLHTFQAGYAEAEITPPKGLPMWGYGARHALTAQGTMDPLMARAVVVHAGEDKLAIVGVDLGRSPTAAMMQEIRTSIREKAGIDYVLISGSHTHHGPVIELTDKKGYGRGTFDEAVAWSQSLPGLLTEAILMADQAVRPAQLGVSSVDLALNRNRHSKRQPKAIDRALSVMRIDDTDHRPIAVVVNYAAHPVLADTQDLRYSGDYPGHLARKVQQKLGAGCVFMQGASGDMSTSPPDGQNTPQAYGELIADSVVKLANAIDTEVPEEPSVDGRVDRFSFESRVDFNNIATQLLYSAAFFPELVRNTVDEFQEGIPAELNTVLLNGNIALVGGSGEFFCNHGLRLKQRSYVDHTLFFGYCNGHSLYFPTIEAVSEGGYGAAQEVSPVEIGAGEKMMNRALINIYTMKGLFPE